MAQPPHTPPEPPAAEDGPDDEDTGTSDGPVCVMCFNANDPSGAAGLGADTTALASVGVHALGVVTGAYARDSAEIFEHFAFDSEAVAEQARAVLEDMNVEIFKVGFVGSPENVAAVAEITTDYPEVPVVAYMPNLSWWTEEAIENYLDAFKELMLPQTTVLVGNHSTLWRWLLPASPSGPSRRRSPASPGVSVTCCSRALASELATRRWRPPSRRPTRTRRRRPACTSKP